MMNLHKLRAYTHGDYRNNTVVVLLDDTLIRLDLDGARGLAQDLVDVADELDSRAPVVLRDVSAQ
jgi:ABC-type enterochelin transport system ATPase subunit